MDDKEIERIAGELGKRAEQDLDLDRVAARVIDRLRREPVQSMGIAWWRRRSVWRAAAAIVLVLGATLLTQRFMSMGGSDTPAAVPLALDELSVDDLAEVLDSLAFEGPVHPLVGAGLDDLNEAQLRELLATMEI